jgi:hypothetical protein
MSYETLGDLIRDMHDNPNDDFAAHLDRVALRDAIRWARELYEAGEQMHEELRSLCADFGPEKTIGMASWDEARKLESDPCGNAAKDTTPTE